MATRWRQAAALSGAFALVGCSWLPNAVNPVAWYRDLTGASKNDALDKNAPNGKNLEAGGKQPYPNLASVPAAPGNATSQLDRDALQKSLVADRTNAQYTDEQLRAGLPPPIPVPPPPSATAPTAAAPAAGGATQQAAASPSESPLASPTIPVVPQGEVPAPPPPAPNLGAEPNTAERPPQQVASLPAARRRAVTQSDPVASFSFSDGASTLSEEERSRVGEVAAMQHAQGGTVRVVAHAAGAEDAAAQQKLANFTLALTRAKAVAQALASDGVPQQSIAVEAVPAKAGDTEAGTTELFLEH